MPTADAQIRVSKRVKKRLGRRRRKNESYNDVLERLLEGRNGDFYEGFGTLNSDEADLIREKREEAKAKRKKRMQRLED